MVEFEMRVPVVDRDYLVSLARDIGGGIIDAIHELITCDWPVGDLIVATMKHGGGKTKMAYFNVCVSKDDMDKIENRIAKIQPRVFHGIRPSMYIRCLIDYDRAVSNGDIAV